MIEFNDPRTGKFVSLRPDVFGEGLYHGLAGEECEFTRLPMHRVRIIARPPGRKPHMGREICMVLSAHFEQVERFKRDTRVVYYHVRNPEVGSHIYSVLYVFQPGNGLFPQYSEEHCQSLLESAEALRPSIDPRMVAV